MTNSTYDVANELLFAREKLSKSGKGTDLDANASRFTWSGYCSEIGSSRQVVSRILRESRKGRRVNFSVVLNPNHGTNHPPYPNLVSPKNRNPSLNSDSFFEVKGGMPPA